MFYFERLKWYIKQLLPLTYVSEYTTDGDCDSCGKKQIVTVWRMWFGHCFNIREWEVTKHPATVTEKAGA